MAYCVSGCWTASGRMGIGTDAPSAALHIVGAHTSGLGIINAISSDSSILNLDSGTADARLRLKYQGNERWFAGMSDTGFAYHIQNSNNACISLAVSYTTGNVGIGTCVPIGLLEVRGASCTISSHGLLQVNSSTSVGIDLGGSLSFGGAYQSTSVTEWAQISGRKESATSGEYGGYLDFATRPHLSLNTSRMRITSTGNVGIGTTSPTTGKLEVSGSILTSGGLVAALANSAALSFESTFSRLIAFGTDASTNGCFRLISSRSDGSNQLTWLAGNASGNVGINCTTPSYKLHVNGTFYAAGSSQDYKQSICNYNTDSCMFMKLKPVTYQYKEEYCHLGKELKSGTQIGLIAEEVAESHPELAILVNEEDNKVVRNVDYEKLTIILLSELQKLRQEVDQLKNK